MAGDDDNQQGNRPTLPSYATDPKLSFKQFALKFLEETEQKTPKWLKGHGVGDADLHPDGDYMFELTHGRPRTMLESYAAFERRFPDAAKELGQLSQMLGGKSDSARSPKVEQEAPNQPARSEEVTAAWVSPITTGREGPRVKAGDPLEVTMPSDGIPVQENAVDLNLLREAQRALRQNTHHQPDPATLEAAAAALREPNGWPQPRERAGDYHSATPNPLKDLLNQTRTGDQFHSEQLEENASSRFAKTLAMVSQDPSISATAKMLAEQPQNHAAAHDGKSQVVENTKSPDAGASRFV